MSAIIAMDRIAVGSKFFSLSEIPTKRKQTNKLNRSQSELNCNTRRICTQTHTNIVRKSAVFVYEPATIGKVRREGDWECEREREGEFHKIPEQKILTTTQIELRFIFALRPENTKIGLRRIFTIYLISFGPIQADQHHDYYCHQTMTTTFDYNERTNMAVTKLNTDEPGFCCCW